MDYYFGLFVLAVLSFIQNMAFTWASRSRNSGNPNYHRYAAWCSNSLWLVCNLLVWKNVWDALETQDFYSLIPVFLVYVIATTEGSVLMMKFLIKFEKGKNKVGS